MSITKHFFSWLTGQQFIKYMDGGGGGGSQPTQSNVYQTNIPDYAQPYVETMLGTAQQQILTMHHQNLNTKMFLSIQHSRAWAAQNKYKLEPNED